MLKIVASADLGGLGAKQGPPVTYNWMRASILPAALPWLAVLLLLLLKPNRCARAWWIWAPVVFLAGGIGLLPVSPSLPSQLLEVLQDLIWALAFGLAAAWLLAAYLKSRLRFLNVLGFLLTLLGFSVVLFLFTQDWSEGPGIAQALQVGIVLAVSACIISVAVGLAGLLCRRRYRPLVLCGWLAVMLPGLCLLVISPILLFETLATGGRVPMSALFAPVLVTTGLCFGVLLPFLLLSFANAFYRQRLINLLLLAPKPPPLPPVAAPPPAPALSEWAADRLKAAASAATAAGHGPADPASHTPS